MAIPIEKPSPEEVASLLRIDGELLPFGSVRDLEQTYEPEQLGSLERALDGGLVYLGIPGFGKRLNVKFTGEGSTMPNFMEWDPWMVAEIQCVEPIRQRGQLSPAQLMRPHVPGSLRYQDVRCRSIGTEGMAASPDVRWTQFRPIILACPESFSYTGRELSKERSWDWTWREHKDKRLNDGQ